MASFADISIRFQADLKQFSSQMQNAERSMKKFGSQMTKVGSGLSVGITLPILALGAASVKAASDAEETASKFDTVFRDISGAAQTAAAELENSYGQSSQASKQLLSDTGDLLTGFGFSQKAALDLSTEVNKLAIDLASFTNFSGGAEGASKALTKALLGEREGVKSLGISILEADVQAQVLKNTQEGLTFETERQAKAFATLQLAQNQSKNAIGDYARTNKSFANQARLLRARIQDLSEQFGKVLLPYFTDAISKVNSVVNRLKNMDESTRKVVVVVAALAAAVGPLLVTIGYMATNVIPGLIIAFAKAKAAFTALSVVMAANPLGALAIAVAAVAAGFLLFKDNTEKAVQAQSSLRSITAQAAKSVAKEKAELERLLFVARDENVSKEQRVKAIKELNKISPKYLGFLNTENINTAKAKEAVEEYTKALIENAKVKAAEEKLIDVQKRIIENELALSSRRQSVEGDRNKTLKELQATGLSAAQAENALSVAKKILDADTQNLNKSLKEEERLLLSIIGSAEKLDEVTPITITDTEGGERVKLKAALEIDPQGATGINETVAALERQLQTFELARQSYAATSEEYARLTAAIDITKQSIDDLQQGVTGELMPESYFNTDAIDRMAEKMQYLKEVGEEVSVAVSGAFESFAGRFVDSLKLADDGFQGFVKGLISTVIKLISMMLAQSLSQAIAGATASGVSTGPAAVFTTPAFIATAVAGVLSAFAAIPKFASGGLVYGPTLGLMGEYSGASSNPEVIAPLSKLKSLLGDGGAQVFIPQTVLRGQDIVISYERTTARNNRLK